MKRTICIKDGIIIEAPHCARPEPQIDRDALLVLADQLERESAELCRRILETPLGLLSGWEPAVAQNSAAIASRIREACGLTERRSDPYEIK